MKHNILIGAAIILSGIVISLLAGQIISEESFKDAIPIENFSINIYILLNNMIPIEYVGLFFAAFVLLFFIYFHIKQDKEIVSTVIALIIFSPAFIYTSVNGNQALAGLAIYLATMIFIKKYKYVSYIFAALGATLNIEIALMLALGFLATSAYMYKKDLRNLFLGTTIIAIISSFISRSVFESQISLSKVLTQFIFEFGGISGSSIILIVIAVISTLLFWKKNPPIFIIPLNIILLISIISENHLIFHIIISILAGPLITRIIYKKWSIDLIKKSSLIALFVLLTINMISFYQAYQLEDTSEIITIISENIPENSLILTSSQKGYMIEKKTGIQTYRKYDLKEDISEQIYHSTSLTNTINLIENINITHIVITQRMIEDIWEGRYTGLLIMVRDKDHFLPLYASEKIEIYQVISRD